MEQLNLSSVELRKRLQKLRDKDYRDVFLETDVKSGIAYQIHALREQLALNQTEFAKKIGKTQTVVSRLEDTEYGAVNLNTLLQIAKSLDVALQVRFCDYVELLSRDISPAAMKVDTILETIIKCQETGKVRGVDLNISNGPQSSKEQSSWPTATLTTPPATYHDFEIVNSGMYTPIKSSSASLLSTYQ